MIYDITHLTGLHLADELKSQASHGNSEKCDWDLQGLEGLRPGAKAFLLQWLIGTGPAADELHAAIRDLKLVGRRFLSAACRWVRSEMSHRRKLRHALILMDSMVGRHDYLFSLGSECFHVPSPIKAAARLREQGATLIRMVDDIIPASQPQWVPAAASLIHKFRCDPIVRDRVLLLTEIEDYQLN